MNPDLEAKLAVLERISKQVQSPDYEPVTLEVVNRRLAAGEIDQETYDYYVYAFHLTPEAEAKFWEDTKKSIQLGRLGNPNHSAA